MESEQIPVSGNAEYDALPEPMRRTYSLIEYLWLSDWEKGNLFCRETEPEITEP